MDNNLKTIEMAVEKVIKESGYDFENWWREEFESEIRIASREEYDNLSAEAFEIAKLDWASYVCERFVIAACEELGIDYNSENESVEELVEIVKYQLANFDYRQVD